MKDDMVPGTMSSFGAHPTEDPMMTTHGTSVASRQPRPVRCWAVTLLAAAIAFIAIDIVAASAGLALAASGVLQERHRSLVVGVLALSYVVWLIGLRSSVAANARLLATTGTSTNALSKLLFDVTARRCRSDRSRRFAATAGYVAIELVFELPYYATAFGAAVVSDTIDSTDALVFLSGTNLGAGCYEFGVSRLTQSYLRRRAERGTRRGGSHHRLQVDAP